DSILKKAPSADFYEGQSDEADLGYSYSKIDSLLKKMIDENRSKDELLALGFEDEFIETIKKRVKINEFKRRLPIIAKI
ncbi:MAG TPA: NAD(+) synthetase, partial [Aliarcobacter cryaerophilus]|nr:NAD(+) synthetase [Aliarcobacter cryaerophilus]